MTDTTADRVALRDLVQAYAEGCDTRDAALLRSCFADGATLTVHWVDREATTMDVSRRRRPDPRGPGPLRPHLPLHRQPPGADRRRPRDRARLLLRPPRHRCRRPRHGDPLRGHLPAARPTAGRSPNGTSATSGTSRRRSAAEEARTPPGRPEDFLPSGESFDECRTLPTFDEHRTRPPASPRSPRSSTSSTASRARRPATTSGDGGRSACSA